jgi:hypothetical protein
MWITHFWAYLQAQTSYTWNSYLLVLLGGICTIMSVVLTIWLNRIETSATTITVTQDVVAPRAPGLALTQVQYASAEELEGVLQPGVQSSIRAVGRQTAPLDMDHHNISAITTLQARVLHGVLLDFDQSIIQSLGPQSRTLNINTHAVEHARRVEARTVSGLLMTPQQPHVVGLGTFSQDLVLADQDLLHAGSIQAQQLSVAQWSSDALYTLQQLGTQTQSLNMGHHALQRVSRVEVPDTPRVELQGLLPLTATADTIYSLRFETVTSSGATDLWEVQSSETTGHTIHIRQEGLYTLCLRTLDQGRFSVGEVGWVAVTNQQTLVAQQLVPPSAAAQCVKYWRWHDPWTDAAYTGGPSAFGSFPFNDANDTAQLGTLQSFPGSFTYVGFFQADTILFCTAALWVADDGGGGERIPLTWDEAYSVALPVVSSGLRPMSVEISYVG